jgi:ATP-dependent helicase HrpB
LELPPFDLPTRTDCLTRAFSGLTLAKEAQATPIRETFAQKLAPEQLTWIDELAPPALPWSEGRKIKLLYPESVQDEDNQPNSPEAQVKLQECFALKEHPQICEGRLPVKLWLCTPEGKRLEATFNWPAFKLNTYPKLRAGLQKKYPSVPWV